MFEDYKKKLQSRQVTRFEEFQKRIETGIREMENKVRVLSVIGNNPKKDGTDRANFTSNFVFKGQNGEILDCKPGYRSGSIRYVCVTLKTDTAYDDLRRARTVACGLDISTTYVTPEEAQRIGVEGCLEHIDETVYFGTKLCNTAHSRYELSDMDSEHVLKIIDLYRESMETALEKRREALKNLPGFFDECLALANRIKELKKTNEGIDYFYGFICEVVQKSYMYEND